MNCELCTTPGGTVLWEDQRCRVVQVDEAGYPGFCRIIWKSHVQPDESRFRDYVHLWIGGPANRQDQVCGQV